LAASNCGSQTCLRTGTKKAANDSVTSVLQPSCALGERKRKWDKEATARSSIAGSERRKKRTVFAGSGGGVPEVPCVVTGRNEAGPRGTRRLFLVNRELKEPSRKARGVRRVREDPALLRWVGEKGQGRRCGLGTGRSKQNRCKQ